MDLLTSAAIILLMHQFFTNPKFGYVKEKPQAGTGEPVNTESTTKGATSTDEGEENHINHSGIWL